MPTSERLITLLVAAALLLSACRAQPAVPTAVPTDPVAGESALTRTDNQGSVQFAVTPLNLDAPGDTLDFQVVLDTHAIELDWDLAALSTLRTDTGKEVSALSWTGASGHHAEAVLSFPAETADGARLLDGAATLTLIIRDADAPERRFDWELGA